MKTLLHMGFCRGLVTGVLLGIVEAAAFMLERPIKDRGDRILVATCLLLMMPTLIGLLGMVASCLILAAHRIGERILRGKHRGIGLIGGLLLFPFAMTLTSGEAVRVLPGAWALPYVICIVAGCTLPFLARFLEAGASPSWSRGLLMLALTGVLGALDRKLLVGLYPAWHHLLALGAALAALLAMCHIQRGSPTPRRRMTLLTSIGLGGIVLFVTQVAYRPLLIQVVAEKTTLAGNLVESLASLGWRPGKRRDLNDKEFARLAAVHVLERGRAIEPAAGPLPLVVLVTLEATRLDHMGYAGYARNVSPNLDAFAAGALDARSAWASHNASAESLTSLLGGLYKRPREDQRGDREVSRMMKGLRTLGTHAFTLFPHGGVVRKNEIFGSFDEVAIYQGHSEDFLSTAIETLKTKRDGPLFLWAHLADPHHPYEPRPDDRRFGSTDLDLYDGEILAMDRAFGQLMDAVDSQFGFDRCVIAVTGDHGEAFGEHGFAFHKSSLHEEQIRVPFLIRAPGLTPHRVDYPVSHVDMMPTVFSWAGWPLPAGDGRILRGNVGSRRPVFATHLRRALAVRQGRFKLMLTHRFGALQLFDLQDDPGERNNLAPSLVELATQLEDHLLAFDAGRGGLLARMYGETPVVNAAQRHLQSPSLELKKFAEYLLRIRGLLRN